MDFGKIPVSELQHADLTLPPDPKVTTEVLKQAKGKGKTNFYVGCAKWGRKEWIGKLYAPGTKEKDFLQCYSGIFNSIEFNAVGYKLPTKEQVRGWRSKVGKDFQFCPKFTNLITHIKRLKNTGEEVGKYLDVMSELGSNLGPIFLLPTPQMSLKDLDTIKNFLTELPEDVSVFLELRHPDWYSEGRYNKDLYHFLRENKRGTVITDTAGRRDCVHMHLSTPECFIRFEGNSLDATDYTRIDDWVQRLKAWSTQGLKRCYFFMHQHEELHSPALLKYFIEEVNKHCGTGLKVPQMLDAGS